MFAAWVDPGWSRGVGDRGIRSGGVVFDDLEGQPETGPAEAVEDDGGSLSWRVPWWSRISETPWLLWAGQEGLLLPTQNTLVCSRPWGLGYTYVAICDQFLKPPMRKVLFSIEWTRNLCSDRWSRVTGDLWWSGDGGIDLLIPKPASFTLGAVYDHSVVRRHY